ncbi:hypothetical protein C0Q70_01901 [Pomacea canaliculata]|uniref:Uncharacterized protein n=1 Tax=Pomacea canaliculata TaxID=400727 RepID=A0A2T7Q0S6_POMCA|nr:hypothetical protein C0Q70_01901 [Pomacea canaliculata]
MCNSERNKRMCEHLEGDVSALEQDCDKLATAGRRNVTYTVCRKMYQLKKLTAGAVSYETEISSIPMVRRQLLVLCPELSCFPSLKNSR